MFGVGLHFSIKDLMSVRTIAVPGAIAQIAAATLLGMGLAWTLGWSTQAGLVFGLALSVASTVVLLRAMQERRLIETRAMIAAVTAAPGGRQIAAPEWAALEGFVKLCKGRMRGSAVNGKLPSGIFLIFVKTPGRILKRIRSARRRGTQTRSSNAREPGGTQSGNPTDERPLPHGA